MEVIDIRALPGVAVLDESAGRPPRPARPARILAHIDVAAHLPGHLRCRLEAQGHLLIDAHRDVLLLAGHRVDLGLAHVDREADQRDHQGADQPTERKPTSPLHIPNHRHTTSLILPAAQGRLDRSDPDGLH